MREHFSISHFIGKYLFDKMYDGGEARVFAASLAIEKRHIAAALLLCPEDGTGAVQLSVVLFLTANNGYTNGCTTADKHKDNEQSRVACVAGLRNRVLKVWLLQQVPEWPLQQVPEWPLQ